MQSKSTFPARIAPFSVPEPLPFSRERRGSSRTLVLVLKLVYCNGTVISIELKQSTGVSAMRVHPQNKSCIMWRCNELASLSCM